MNVEDQFLNDVQGVQRIFYNFDSTKPGRNKIVKLYFPLHYQQYIVLL